MKLGFSSLACMEASLPELIAYAKNANLCALEIRLDKNDRICGMEDADVLAYLPAIKEAGLFISDLGSSVAFTKYDAERVARGKRNLDLAASVGATGLRVFLDHDKSCTPPAFDFDGAVQALKELCAYGASVGVEIWLETHGTFSTGASLRPVLDAVADPQLKIIWDIIHSVEYGESIEESIALIGKDICHIHIKDGVKPEDHPTHIQYILGALGAGEVDTAASVRLLDGIGFDGVYSLEWESAWHPELIPLYKDIPALLDAFCGYMAK